MSQHVRLGAGSKPSKIPDHLCKIIIESARDTYTKTGWHGKISWKVSPLTKMELIEYRDRTVETGDSLNPKNMLEETSSRRKSKKVFFWW